MKIAIALLTVALGATLPVQGAGAADSARDASLTTASQDHDLSAKKKKRRYVQVHPSQYGYYPQAFAPGDPSWQSPDMLRRRAIGECIIDLGYGRWESCSSAGGGRR